MTEKTKAVKGAARTRSARKCGVVYDGPSYPEEHGVQCYLPRGHDKGAPHGPQKHAGHSKIVGRPSVHWYTEAQKAARQEENEAIRQALRSV